MDAKESSGGAGAGAAGRGAEKQPEEDAAFGFYAVMGVPREASAQVRLGPSLTRPWYGRGVLSCHQNHACNSIKFRAGAVASSVGFAMV